MSLRVLISIVVLLAPVFSRPKPILVQPALNPLRVGCMADTPIILHNCLMVWPYTNKPVTSIECRLTGGRGQTLNCTDTAVLFTGVAPGVHRLIISARTALEDASFTYRLIMPTNSSTCTVHLINQGITVNNTSAIAEFNGFGTYNNFTCKVDGPQAFPCASPLHLHNLTEGEHWLRVIPEGCDSVLRQTFFFTVP